MRTAKAMIYVVTKNDRVVGVFSNQAKAIDFAGEINADVEMWDAQQNRRTATILPEASVQV